MRDHTKLRAFQLADELAIIIYQVTGEFPNNLQPEHPKHLNSYLQPKKRAKGDPAPRGITGCQGEKALSAGQIAYSKLEYGLQFIPRGRRRLEPA